MVGKLTQQVLVVSDIPQCTVQRTRTVAHPVKLPVRQDDGAGDSPGKADVDVACATSLIGGGLDRTISGDLPIAIPPEKADCCPASAHPIPPAPVAARHRSALVLMYVWGQLAARAAYGIWLILGRYQDNHKLVHEPSLHLIASHLGHRWQETEKKLALPSIVHGRLYTFVFAKRRVFMTMCIKVYAPAATIYRRVG